MSSGTPFRDAILRLVSQAEEDPSLWSELDATLDAAGYNINNVDGLATALQAYSSVNVDRAFRLGLLVGDALGGEQIVAVVEGAVETVRRPARRRAPRRRPGR